MGPRTVNPKMMNDLRIFYRKEVDTKRDAIDCNILLSLSAVLSVSESK